MPALASAQLQGQHASRLQPYFSIALGQRQQSQAGAVAVLRMLVFGHQPRHRFRRRRADAGAPVDQPLRRPLHVRAVRRRHVRGHRREATDAAAAGVAGHPLAPVQQFDMLTVTRASSTWPTSACGTL